MNKSTNAPRPSSLRATVAGFFVLSFRDDEFKDTLKFPLSLGNDEKKLDDPKAHPFATRVKHLLWWPPDIFALTSAILSRTGTYRMVVGPHSSLGGELWHRLDWQHRVDAHAEAWRSVISDKLIEAHDISMRQSDSDEALFGKLGKRVKDRSKRRHLAPLIVRSGGRTYSDLFEFCWTAICTLKDADGYLADQNLLAVSVKADRRGSSAPPEAAKFFEAIICLHILADAASYSIGVPRSSTRESAVFDAFANVMLTLRGSLSTVSKFHGVVLPKMRTPQTGMTLRNLSHNLTFHDSEVEVMWRSFPWSNFDENTLNVLYVPYPFDFDPNRFTSESGHYESVGYFNYDPGDWKGVGCVVDLIENVRKAGTQPHLLVFTETAFNEDTYKRLLTALSQRYGTDDPQRMPVVVAGVAKTEHGLPYNELRLATFFAGKWYQLSQHKHHRWQLNADQIRQYGLQGRLSTARPLFESSVIDQRRLTFYAPTPWLVLSPLICEDLARIEPVSELIRGVGPTLILALLLDGPQLAGRWPGRYASVFADDPGSGVLTVTSFGAAHASRPSSDLALPRRPSTDTTPINEKAVVASWRGPDDPFQTLAVGEKQALLATLTAHWGEEYTLDGRGLLGKPTAFRLDGVFVFDIPNDKSDQGIDTRLDLGNWSDIREVTALTYVASAALSLLRPHRSKHPENSDQKTDSWTKPSITWKERVSSVRKLIDIMLGRPVFDDDAKWKSYWKKLLEKNLKKEANVDRSSDEANSFNYRLKAQRDALLCHLFGPRGDERAQNRHLFAVLGFAQSTIDVEVRDEEAKWPTPSLRFASIVLRLLFDSIAGISPERDPSAGENVYLSRLKIAGLSNRGAKELWANDDVEEPDATGIAPDVKGAPRPLLSLVRGGAPDANIRYLRQFKDARQASKPPDAPGDHPSRYDYYRMVIELVDAIVVDDSASLWKECQQRFEGQVGEAEMRRLTLLVLMMLPALIHEQLEYDQIRLKRHGETALGRSVMNDLLKRSEGILTNAAIKTRTPWNPRR